MGNCTKLSLRKLVTISPSFHEREISVGFQLAKLWSKLENKPLPYWTHSQDISKRRLFVSREIFHPWSIIEAFSIRQGFDNGDWNFKKCFQSYSLYCHLRSQFMREQVLGMV